MRLVRRPPGARHRLRFETALVAKPIAVDAMGGDDAPKAVVEGALEAISEGLEVVLVGRPDEIAAAGGASLDVIEASEVIDMSEEPGRAVRTKKDSSISRAINAVRDGQASAAVSAGNTGAMAAAALLRLRRLPGVARPAIAAALPVPGTTPRVLLDSGAMADCNAAWLHQFARMGSVYARTRFGVERPSIGLLSIGEEPEKGSALVKETHKLLVADPEINFFGNIEGRDLLDGPVDVIVTDGFTGNVVLKSLEGTASFFVRLILDRLSNRRPRRCGSLAHTGPAGGRAQSRQRRRGHVAWRSRGLHHRSRRFQPTGHLQRHSCRAPHGRSRSGWRTVRREPAVAPGPERPVSAANESG